jgi:hypothetical protein
MIVISNFMENRKEKVLQTVQDSDFLWIGFYFNAANAA